VKDQNYKLVASMISAMDSIERKHALPEESVKMIKALNSGTPNATLFESEKNNKTPMNQLVGEEQLQAKLKTRFADYIKEIDPPEEDAEEIKEAPRSEFDMLETIFGEIGHIVHELEAMVQTASRKTRDTIQNVTIPALKALANDRSTEGSVANLLAVLNGYATEEITADDLPVVEQITDTNTNTNTFTTTIGPDKSIIAEAKQVNQIIMLYINNKQFNKSFTTISEAKAYIAELDNNLSQD